MRELLVIAAVWLAGGVAVAQPRGAAPPAPEPRAQFDAAFDAMTRGDFANAAVGFREVAATAADPELRGAANQLGRLADDFARRGGRLTFAAAPGNAPPSAGGVVAVSEDDQPDGGRASFVVTTTLASLYTGIVAIDLADVSDVRSGTLLVMGTTAAGLIGSLYGTRGRTMTGGMSDAWSLGLFAGAGNALLLAGPLGLYASTSNADKKVLSFVAGSAWSVATVGLLAADAIRPTRAQVNVMSTIGVMGLGSTLLTLAIIQPSGLSGDAFLTITAGGLDAGLGVGAGFARQLDWSLSRARYVGLSAFLGALAGGGTSLLLFANNGGDNSARVAAGITLAGLWGGFALGGHLTRDMAPDLRFHPRADTTALLVPTTIRGAPGLAVVGAF
jgi:hypothetical protein